MGNSAEWIGWVVLAVLLSSLMSFIGPHWDFVDLLMTNGSTVVFYYVLEVTRIMLSATIYVAIPGLALIRFVSQIEKVRREAS